MAALSFFYLPFSAALNMFTSINFCISDLVGPNPSLWPMLDNVAGMDREDGPVDWAILG